VQSTPRLGDALHGGLQLNKGEGEGQLGKASYDGAIDDFFDEHDVALPNQYQLERSAARGSRNAKGTGGGKQRSSLDALGNPSRRRKRARSLGVVRDEDYVDMGEGLEEAERVTASRWNNKKRRKGHLGVFIVLAR